MEMDSIIRSALTEETKDRINAAVQGAVESKEFKQAAIKAVVNDIKSEDLDFDLSELFKTEFPDVLKDPKIKSKLVSLITDYMDESELYDIFGDGRDNVVKKAMKQIFSDVWARGLSKK